MPCRNFVVPIFWKRLCAVDTGVAGQGGYEGLFILDRHEKQTSPAAFAQIGFVPIVT